LTILPLPRAAAVTCGKDGAPGRTLAPLYAGGNPAAESVPFAPVEAREAASLAAPVAAILHGASIVRVHAVRPAVEAALIADAVLENRP